MKTKRIIAIILTLAMALAMSACGTKPAAEPAKDDSTPVAADNESQVDVSTPEEKEPVTLQMIAHYDASWIAGVEKLNEKFQEKYPWITINLSIAETSQWEELRETRLTAGDVDIVEICSFGTAVPDFAVGASKPKSAEYIENGLIMDLSDQEFMKNWGEVTLAKTCSYNGKLYNTPTGLAATSGVFYNKEIFKQYNLTEPKTWDEFIQICETLKAAGITPMTSGLMDIWPTGMFWQGIAITSIDDIDKWVSNMWTGDASFNSEEVLKVWSKIEDCAQYFEEGLASVDYNSAPGRFMSGKAAMMPDGSWTAAAMIEADPNFEFGYFGIPGDVAPADGGDVQLYGKYDVGIGGCSKTEHPDEVLLYLEFYSQPENYADLINCTALIPVMPGVEAADEFRASLAPKTVNFGIQLSNRYFAPEGAGKYAAFGAASNLQAYGGDISSAEELAALAQGDFASALANIIK